MKKLLILTLFILLTACTPATPDAGAVETAIAQTQAAQPTAVPPTETPVPTATIDPYELTKQANQTQNAAYQVTLNAKATNFALTPSKTPTPQATKTPVPTATPTFAPLILTGTGDSIVDVDLAPGFVGIALISGNTASRHFAVSNYDANNQQIDLLVNTTDVYTGTVPIDFYDGQDTARFQVSATGDWTIELRPLTMARRFSAPNTILGSGDDVIYIMGNNLDTATIIANAASRHFSLQGIGDNGVDLLVNTTDAYTGTVILDPTTFILIINAVGDWTIEVKTR